MMGINYNDWVESTYQNCENPTEWDGKNPSCKLCDNEIEFMDEYCSAHQRCFECGEREICENECENKNK